jgi:hypothetical protein
MKLSLGLPHYGRESSPEVIARFAHEAEQLDYDAVWALERLLRPVKPRSTPFPGWTPPAYYANVYDPIETLTIFLSQPGAPGASDHDVSPVRKIEQNHPP